MKIELPPNDLYRAEDRKYHMNFTDEYRNGILDYICHHSNQFKSNILLNTYWKTSASSLECIIRKLEKNRPIRSAHDRLRINVNIP